VGLGRNLNVFQGSIDRGRQCVIYFCTQEARFFLLEADTLARHIVGDKIWSNSIYHTGNLSFDLFEFKTASVQKKKRERETIQSINYPLCHFKSVWLSSVKEDNLNNVSVHILYRQKMLVSIILFVSRRNRFTDNWRNREFYTATVWKLNTEKSIQKHQMYWGNIYI